jgi:hypothetical protein
MVSDLVISQSPAADHLTAFCTKRLSWLRKWETFLDVA